MQSISNSKRIAKNTILLYFRMLIMMLVAFYTSRVVLDTLGVEDYGIYNVVGGLVAMFSMLSGSLSAAITRFITYELGKGDSRKLGIIFSSSVTIQIGLAIIILIFAESIGLWFLNVKMNIPELRLNAANWVFQFSIFTFIVNLISVPYNACIIAHEKMSAFAYVSILEAVGKLAIAFLISASPIDRLTFYAILMFAVAVIIRFVYSEYCRRHFIECRYRFIFDASVLKQMSNFAGWNFIGASSAVLRDQGGNVIINLFCGPSVNAARGIAFQVNTAIYGFVSNFMTALNPQITKSYALGEKDYMMKLIFQGVRFSFYMLLFLSLPVLLNTYYVLDLWLEKVPDHTVSFVQLILIFAMSESISNPLITAMLATGRIKTYQIVVGGLQMMNLPISYILLRLGYTPEAVILVAIIISQCCLASRLYLLKDLIGLSVSDYMRKVYLNVVLVAGISIFLPLLLSLNASETFSGFLLSSIFSTINTLCVIIFIGCNHKERQFVWDKMNNMIIKYFK